MNLPVEITHGWMHRVAADTIFRDLKEIAWVRRGQTPRMEYFTSTIGRPYTYGKGAFARTYEPNADVPAITLLTQALKNETGVDYELCFLNRYMDQSEHLGWHSDDSPETDDARPIAILSFGVDREIWFRPKPPQPSWSPMTVTKLKLTHGSLCVMGPGMQDTHQHRIPKAGFQCGERISLTFRGAAQPRQRVVVESVEEVPMTEGQRAQAEKIFDLLREIGP